MSLKILGSPPVTTAAASVSSPASANPVGGVLTGILDDFVNGAGAAVGYAELAGFRYPVKPYQLQVTEALSRGSRVDFAGIARLKAQGFRSVVDLRAESNSDASLAQAVGMNCLRLSIIDNTPPTEAQMKQFLDFVTDPANQPAYVHCEKGVGRTGVAVACYRMAVQGWTLDQALADARKVGYTVPDQVAFIRQFSADLALGNIPGYPLTGAARDKALHPPPPDAAPTPAEVSQILDQVSHSTVTPGNLLQPYVDGENAFPQVLATLNAAKRSITYETYVFASGNQSTNQITDALIAAKNRGVDVRVLVDAFGARAYPPRDNQDLDRLRQAGVDVVINNPLSDHVTGDLHRDHRKDIVIDGQLGWIGGMNTGDEWFGPPTYAKRYHDLFAAVFGPMIRQMALDFAASWKLSGGAPLPSAIASPPATAPQPGGVDVRVVEHTPGQDRYIQNAYLTLIDSAQKKVNVENSYPLTPEMAAALAAAARRGVEVNYIVGSDGLITDGGQWCYQQLLDAGAHLFVYPRPIHTKALSVDGQFCTIGSSNVDNYSLDIDREIIALVQDPGFTQSYDRELFDKDMVGDPQGDKTVQLGPNLHEPLLTRIEDAILNLIWPKPLQ